MQVMGIEGYPLNPPWWFFCMKTLTVRNWHESSSPTNAGAASIWYASFQTTNWNYMLVWKNITQMFHVWNIFTYILFFILYGKCRLLYWVSGSHEAPTNLVSQISSNNSFMKSSFFFGCCFLLAMKLPCCTQSWSLEAPFSKVRWSLLLRTFPREQCWEHYDNWNFSGCSVLRICFFGK